MKKVVNVLVVSLALLFVLTGCEKKGVVNAKYEAWFYKEQAKLKEIRAKGKNAVNEVKASEVVTSILPTSTVEQEMSSTIEQEINSASEILVPTPTNLVE